MDWLRAVLIVNLGALLVAASTAAVLAWQNAGSRNLGLAAGTIVATSALFILQVAFELRRAEPTEETFSADFTIDRLEHRIRQWRYTNTYASAGLVHNADRVTYDDGAGPALFKQDSHVFDGDRGLLSQQMAIFDVVVLLLRHESDWQLRRVLYHGQTLGSASTTVPLSKPGEYEVVTVQELRDKLRLAGNPFWIALDGPFLDHPLRLPPHSSLSVFPTTLEIANPFCKVTFSTDYAFAGVDFRNPRDGSDPEPLPNGESRHETRVINVDAKAEFYALRAFHKDARKYVAWTRRLLDDARIWFEGSR